MLAHPETGVPDGVELLPVARPMLSLKGKLLRHSTRLREHLPPVAGEWPLRQKTGWVDTSSVSQVARSHGLDVVVPYVQPLQTPGLRTIGWIPDFQHRHLPEFFHEQECAARDLEYRRLATSCDRMIVSSQAALADFNYYLPGFERRVSVLSFPSLFAFSTGTAISVHETVQKYQLPEKFLLVVNQLWSHKNHITVVRALSELKQAGTNIPVVMIGRPDDYREPGNKSLSTLLQAIAQGGLRDQVALLGEVPFEDLVALMRGAALIVQPSRCEGWSTTVQDARALGRPLLCADLPVLREQAPDALGFFPPQDEGVLATLLRDEWPSLPPGPDLALEQAALIRERSFAEDFGNRLADVCFAATASGSAR